MRGELIKRVDRVRLGRVGCGQDFFRRVRRGRRTQSRWKDVGKEEERSSVSMEDLERFRPTTHRGMNARAPGKDWQLPSPPSESHRNERLDAPRSSRLPINVTSSLAGTGVELGSSRTQRSMSVREASRSRVGRRRERRNPKKSRKTRRVVGESRRRTEISNLTGKRASQN